MGLNQQLFCSGNVSGKNKKIKEVGGNFSVPFPQQAVMPAKHQQSPAQYNQAQPPVQVQGHGEQSGSEAGGTLAFLLPLKSLRSST